MDRCRKGFWIVVLLICTYGCATTNSSPEKMKLPGCDVPLKKRTTVTVPKRISVMPVKVEIRELNAGGTTEEVPGWSEHGKKIVKQCVLNYCTSNLNLEIVPLGELPDEQKALLDQYRALYEVVAANERYIRNFPAWKHMSGKVMTLGDGMAAFKEQLGADAMLFVSGYDLQSTAGRKAAFALYAILSGGGSLPMGHSVLHTGVVEVDSGDILWTHINTSTSSNLNDDQAVDAMVRSSFTDFPSAVRQE